LEGSLYQDQTGDLLKQIEEIKTTKEKFSKLTKEEDAIKLKKELNKKLEDKLNDLLYLILEEDSKGQDPSTMKDGLKKLLRNVDSLHGKKTSDGHLKSKLLF